EDRTTKRTKTQTLNRELISFRGFVCFVSFVALMVAMFSGVGLFAQARPQPATKLPLSQLEAQMFHVSAGKRLKPAVWPNGARVAVGLSFDVDNATAELATGNLISEVISRGEYGAIDGVPRILRLVAARPPPASLFPPLC